MTESRPAGSAPRPFEDLALEKLTRVLGPTHGRRVFTETLSIAALGGIHSADDLYLFGETLARRGGFEAAVGTMLGVAAVLRGAAGRPRSA